MSGGGRPGSPFPKRRRVVSDDEDDDDFQVLQTIPLSDGREIMISYKSAYFQRNQEEIKNLYTEFCESKKKDPESTRTNAAEVSMSKKQK